MKSLAKTLKLASVDRMQTPSRNIESHWYRSDGPADLFFWTSDGKIIKHQLNLFGQIVEWNQFDGMKTGYMEDIQPISGSTDEMICFDRSPNIYVAQKASEFLLGATALDTQTRETLNIHYCSYFQWDGLAKTWLGRLWKRLFSSN